MENPEDLSDLIYKISPPPMTIKQIKTALESYDENAPEDDDDEGGIESEEFYNRMQIYRHTQPTDQDATLKAYHAVIYYVEQWALAKVAEFADGLKEHLADNKRAFVEDVCLDTDMPWVELDIDMNKLNAEIDEFIESFKQDREE